MSQISILKITPNKMRESNSQYGVTAYLTAWGWYAGAFLVSVPHGSLTLFREYGENLSSLHDKNCLLFYGSFNNEGDTQFRDYYYETCIIIDFYSYPVGADSPLQDKQILLVFDMETVGGANDVQAFVGNSLVRTFTLDGRGLKGLLMDPAPPYVRVALRPVHGYPPLYFYSVEVSVVG